MHLLQHGEIAHAGLDVAGPVVDGDHLAFESGQVKRGALQRRAGQLHGFAVKFQPPHRAFGLGGQGMVGEVGDDKAVILLGLVLLFLGAEFAVHGQLAKSVGGVFGFRIGGDKLGQLVGPLTLGFDRILGVIQFKGEPCPHFAVVSVAGDVAARSVLGERILVLTEPGQQGVVTLVGLMAGAEVVENLPHPCFLDLGVSLFDVNLLQQSDALGVVAGHRGVFARCGGRSRRILVEVHQGVHQFLLFRIDGAWPGGDRFIARFHIADTRGTGQRHAWPTRIISPVCSHSWLLLAPWYKMAREGNRKKSWAAPLASAGTQ